MKWNWQKEVSIHSDEKAHILGQKVNKKGIIRVGSTKDKITDVLNIDELPYFIITNIESFRDEDFSDAIKFACKSGKISMCIAEDVIIWNSS